MEQMAAAFTALQRQNEHMQQQLLQTQQQLSQLQVQRPAADHHGKRLPKPPRFAGRRGDSSALNWCHQMETYLTATDIQLDTTEAVNFAAGFLLDTALTWFRLHRKKVADGTATDWTSWNTFKDEILRRFQPIEPEQLARTKLLSLKQTKSVRSYADAFNQCLLEVPEYIEKDMVMRFVKGLQKDVRVHVQSQKPATVDAAIDLAIQMDAVLREADRDDRQLTRRPGRNFGNSRNYRPANRYPSRQDRYSTTGSAGPVPMDLGAAELRRNPSHQPPRTQLNRGFNKPNRQPAPPAQIRCYNCNQFGHPAKLCPQKKRSGNFRPKRR